MKLLLLLALSARAELTLEQKVGQVFMVVANTATVANYEPYIREGRLGGALLPWQKFTGEEARAHSVMLSSWSAPSGAPFLLAVDHEGGQLFTERKLGATIFPGNMALGAIGSADLARRAAEASGRELRSFGLAFNFAPVLDVNTNPDNPIIGARSFGEQPNKTARLARAVVEGYRAAGIPFSVKHFPGHGDTSVDSHLGLPVSSKPLGQLQDAELIPFKAAIQAGAPAVMPAHIVFPALGDADKPVTLSSAALKGFLRGKLKFKGLIVSDSMDMGAITSKYGAAESAVLAFDAGNDLLSMGKGDFPAAYEALLAAVKSGRISEARLDESVDRIMALKMASAPLDPLTPEELERNRALAREIADRSVTLVRRERGVLPLSPRKKLLVVLPRSNSYAAEGDHFLAELKKRAPDAETVALGPQPKGSVVDEVLAKAAAADTIVYGLYFFGPLGKEQTELGQRLLALKKPVVFVSMLNPYGLRNFPAARTALCIYGMTPYALESAVKALFGEIRARGKLPVTIPGFARRGTGL